MISTNKQYDNENVLKAEQIILIVLKTWEVLWHYLESKSWKEDMVVYPWESKMCWVNWDSSSKDKWKFGPSSASESSSSPGNEEIRLSSLYKS